MLRHIFFRLSILLLALGGGSTTQAAVEYTAIDLNPALPTGADSTMGWEITNSGWILAQALDNSDQVIAWLRWNPTTKAWTDLGKPAGITAFGSDFNLMTGGISDTGVVHVNATATDGTTRWLVAPAASGLAVVTITGATGNDAEALGCAADGRGLGSLMSGTHIIDNFRAVLRSSDGTTITNLAAAYLADKPSRARALAGSYVCGEDGPSGTLEMFRILLGTAASRVTVPFPSGTTVGYALDVNATGWVIGGAQGNGVDAIAGNFDDVQVGYVWKGSGAPVIMNVSGANRTYATSINDAGVVVGEAYGVVPDFSTLTLFAGFRWDPVSNTAVNINTLVPSAVTATDVLEINKLESINQNGQIVGQGIGNSGTAHPSVVLLTPIPTVTISTPDATATEAGTTTGAFTITRTGATTYPLTVTYTIAGGAGQATLGGDYTLSAGASATSITLPAGAASATISVTPIDDLAFEADETVTLTLASSTGNTAVTSAYALSGSISGSITIISDDASGAPTVTLASTAPSLTNLTSVPCTVVFSEAVTGFAVGDITTSNATVTGFAGSGASYTFNVVPTAQGIFTAAIPDGAATGTVHVVGSVASTPLSRTFDSVSPSTTLASSAPAVTSLAIIPVTLTFSEAVSGVALSDITVTNGTASDLTGSGSSYTLQIHPSAAGTVSVQVAAAIATDAAGNGNTAATPLTFTYTLTGPTVTINQAAGQADPTTTPTFAFTVVFSAAVSDFVAADVQVGGTATGTPVINLSGSGTIYTVTITGLTGAGTVTAIVPADVATTSGPNAASTSSDNIITYAPAAGGGGASSSGGSSSNGCGLGSGVATAILGLFFATLRLFILRPVRQRRYL